MKYIKNTLDYAVKFKADGKEYEFDCFRTYSDTGNVATTGVTPIDEKDWEKLSKIKVVSDFVKKGLLKETTKDEAQSVASEIDALSKENEVLKAQLEAKTKEAEANGSEELAKAKDEADKLTKENESLKAQLEALKKKSTKKDKSEEKSDGSKEGDNGGF